jgi:hypothetical protein
MRINMTGCVHFEKIFHTSATSVCSYPGAELLHSS